MKNLVFRDSSAACGSLRMTKNVCVLLCAFAPLREIYPFKEDYGRYVNIMAPVGQ